MKISLSNKFTLYDLVYTGLAPLLVPYFLLRYATRGKSIHTLKGMLGGGLKGFNRIRDAIGNQPVAWFHAVSMGEVAAATAVIREFCHHFPDYKLFLSTITETGQDRARKQLKNIVSLIFYHPLDLTPLVKRFLLTLRPSIYIILETEIWPNMLLGAKERGVKIFMVNGKLSDRSYRFYRWGKGVMRPALQAIDVFAMQTEEDAGKMADLLGSNHNIFVTGNCKFDIEIQGLSPEEQGEILNRCRFPKGAKIVVVGSTHPGEEEIMLDVFQEAKKAVPGLKMIIAPRHPARFDSVYRWIKNKGVRVSCFSNPDVDDPEIVVLDEMGKLARIYGVGDVAVVAGSFAKIGGHNLLEAAIHKIPVIYGPYMHQQKEITEIMNNSGGGYQVGSHNLPDVLVELLKDDEKRKKAGEAAFEAAIKNRGSTKKTIEIIKQYLQ